MLSHPVCLLFCQFVFLWLCFVIWCVFSFDTSLMQTMGLRKASTTSTRPSFLMDSFLKLLMLCNVLKQSVLRWCGLARPPPPMMVEPMVRKQMSVSFASQSACIPECIGVFRALLSDVLLQVRPTRLQLGSAGWTSLV